MPNRIYRIERIGTAYYLYVGDTLLGIWTYIEAVLETIRKHEIEVPIELT